MKKRIRLLIELAIITLIVVLLFWRFIPRSSSCLISIDESACTGFSAIATDNYIEDGTPGSDVYRIDPPNDAVGDILEILSTSRYRPDLRNLLPGALRAINADKHYDGRIISLSFSTDAQLEQIVSIQFLSNTLVAVQNGYGSGFCAYHPTNRYVFDKLVEYLQTNGTTTEDESHGVHYSLDYSYCVEGDVHIAKETLQALNAFGKSEYIFPAESEIKRYTELPEIENNAKGWDPISFVLPDFDLTNYSDTRYLTDYESGMEIAVYYRMLGDRVSGIPSDEMVKVYIDTSGKITWYETVNLGKYDKLNLDETQFGRLQNSFTQAITGALNVAPKDLKIFTDSQGRIVLAATAYITQEHQNIDVTLYAVVKESLKPL